jgi:hypothetical protein
MDTENFPLWATDSALGSSRQPDSPQKQLNLTWRMKFPEELQLSKCVRSKVEIIPSQVLRTALLNYKETGKMNNSIPKYVFFIFESACAKMVDLRLKNEKTIAKLQKEVSDAEAALEKKTPIRAFPLDLKIKNPCITPHSKSNGIIAEANKSFLEEAEKLKAEALKAITEKFIKDAKLLIDKLSSDTEFEISLTAEFGAKFVTYCPDKINFWDSDFVVSAESDDGIRYHPLSYSIRKLALEVSAFEAREKRFDHLFYLESKRLKKAKEVEKESAAQEIIENMQVDGQRNGFKFDDLVEAIAAKVSQQFDFQRPQSSPKNRRAQGSRGRSPTRRRSSSRSKSRSKSRSRSRSASRESRSQQYNHSPSPNRRGPQKQSPNPQSPRRGYSRSPSPGGTRSQRKKEMVNRFHGRSQSPVPGILKSRHSRDWASRSTSPKQPKRMLHTDGNGLKKNGNQPQKNGKTSQNSKKQNWTPFRHRVIRQNHEKGEKEFVPRPLNW